MERVENNIEQLNKYKTSMKINYLVVSKYIFNFLVLTTIFYLSSRASIDSGYIRTFGFSIYFGLLWGKFEPLSTSIAYLIAGSLSRISVYNIANVFITIICGLLYTYIFIRRDRKSKVFCVILSILSQVLYIYEMSSDMSSIVVAIFGVALGGVVTFATINALSCTILHNFSKRLVIDEKVSLAVLITIISMGIATLKVSFFEPIRIIFILGTLLLVDLGYSKHILYYSICMGLGASLYFLDATYISAFALIGLICQIFLSTNRYFVAISTLLVDTFMGTIFACYNDYNILSVTIILGVCAVYLLIPKKVICKILKYIPSDVIYDASEEIVTRSQNILSDKLKNLSGIFLEMERTYRNMTSTIISREDIKNNVASEIVNICCKNCPNKDKCLRQNGGISYEVFSDMLDAGIGKGKINLIDVNQYLSTRCNKLNSLISTANNSIASFKDYEIVRSNMDQSRLLIADQLNGVSTILADLSDKIKCTITYDHAKEESIKIDAGYIGLCVDDCAVVGSGDDLKVTLTLKSQMDLKDTKKLNKIINRICGNRMTLVDVTEGDIKTYVYKIAPHYNITYGCASCTKSHVIASGDTHTLIKINDGKYMMALCDGMGSGKEARVTSTLAISLIENFYRAGFDSDLILSTVNRLLAMKSNENFSALDLCIIDTRNNVMDFIKLGAPYGLIKNNCDIDIIDEHGLPIGVVDEMSPHIVHRQIRGNDMIIMFSDGVCDTFDDQEKLLNFIKSQDVINPQILAERILKFAIDETDEVRDDMSVCVTRLVE